MTAKNILNTLEQYQKARVSFVQSINEFASRPQNAEYLLKCNILELVTPLCADPIPSIQNNAVTALGKLASHRSDIANSVVQHGSIVKMIKDLDKRPNFYKKSAMFCLKSVVKHNAKLSESVVQIGGLDAILYCLNSFDSGIKAEAACALANIASHNADLARAVDKAGGIPLLVFCLDEPENCLRQTACLALCEITKHSIDLAQSVVDAHATPALVKQSAMNIPKIKAQVYRTLGNISKHSEELSEAVVGAEVLPQALLDLSHPDETVRRSAATLIRDIVKHSAQFAQLVVNSGGVAALLNMMSENDLRTKLLAVVTIGYIAGHSEKFALALIASDSVSKLAKVLNEEKQDHLLAATVWALGHLGRHSSEHARHLARVNVYTKLVEMMADAHSSEDLKSKCKSTLKFTILSCNELSALEPLLHSSPDEILKYVLRQIHNILPNDPKARRQFAASGGLRRLQEIHAEPGSSLMEEIGGINVLYPEEIIRYFTPSYPETLLKKLDTYLPQVPSTSGSPQKTFDQTADISLGTPLDSDCEC